MAGIDNPEGGAVHNVPDADQHPIAQGAEGAEDANLAPRVNYRRGFLIVAGVAGVAGAVVALPIVIRGVTNLLESAVESRVEIGPLLVRLTQPVSHMVGPAIRGVCDGILRFVQGTPLSGAEALMSTVHTFANGTQVVLTHTGEELIDLGVRGGTALLNAAPNGVRVAGVTVDIALQTGWRTINLVGVELNPMLREGLLGVVRETAAQQTQRLLVVGTEYAVTIAAWVWMHALFLGVQPVRDPLEEQVIPHEEAVVIGPDMEQLEQQRALDRQPLPIVAQLDRLAALQGAQPVVNPVQGVGVGAHIDLDLDAALLRLER